MLPNTPVLNIVDHDERIAVYIDACKQGIGGVLTHNGHVIIYESKKLKEHEKNCATHDLYLASIIHTLKMWRHYLMGKKFE